MNTETLNFIAAPNNSLESYINYLNSNEGQVLVEEYNKNMGGNV